MEKKNIYSRCISFEIHGLTTFKAIVEIIGKLSSIVRITFKETGFYIGESTDTKSGTRLQHYWEFKQKNMTHYHYDVTDIDNKKVDSYEFSVCAKDIFQILKNVYVKSSGLFSLCINKKTMCNNGLSIKILPASDVHGLTKIVEIKSKNTGKKIHNLVNKYYPDTKPCGKITTDAISDYIKTAKARKYEKFEFILSNSGEISLHSMVGEMTLDVKIIYTNDLVSDFIRIDNESYDENSDDEDNCVRISIKREDIDFLQKTQNFFKYGIVNIYMVKGIFILKIPTTYGFCCFHVTTE